MFALIILTLYGALALDSWMIYSEIGSVLRKSSNDTDSVKPVRIIKYCGTEMVKCMINQDCIATLNCFYKCERDNIDCNNHCFMELSNPTFSNLASCMIKNKCLPEMNFSAQSCPGDTIHASRKGLIEDIFLKNNIGRYYVARGWNRAYDCADCQKLEYQGFLGSLQVHWSSNESNGKVKSVNNTLHQDGENTMMTKYSLFGMDVEEHYYLLDWTNDGSWVLFYYCGYGFGSEYQGALLLTREYDFDTIPTNIEQKFNIAILEAGLSEYVGPLSSWCKPNFSSECKKFNL